MPPDLLDFQRSFAAALDEPADGAMAVYRNTVIHGAVEALRANYPVIEQLLGAEMFERVAVDHATRCPPRRPVLALYGGRFADWLEEQDWAADIPYLSDVARVERLRVECLMAADAEPLLRDQAPSLAELRDTTLRLHPSLRFAWLTTPAMTIWLAHGSPIEAGFAPEWKAEGALFSRPDPFTLHAPRIGRAAHRLLVGIRLGDSVGRSLDAAIGLYPDEDCEALFDSLLNLGAFAAPSARIGS